MNNSNLLITLLVIVAIVLGAILYYNYGPAGRGGAGSDAVQTGTVPDLLTPPDASAGADEQEAYAARVRQNAQEASQITLGSDCQPDPLIARIATSTGLTVVNKDAVAHTITFDATHTYTLAPGSSRAIEDDAFPHGASIYGYGCDSSPRAAGMIVVGA